MVSEEFYADTWTHSDGNHNLANETAYTEDSPPDYYFPTGTEQWEPDSLIQLNDGIDEEMYLKNMKKHHRAHKDS